MMASKRLCVAPKVARVSLTAFRAASMSLITVAIAPDDAAAPMDAAVEVTTVISVAWLMLAVVTLISSSIVVLAPIWKVSVVASAPMMCLPLKVVPPSTRVISACNCANSLFSESLSELELVALRACTASSRMRCRLSPTFESEPSAVCASEMPSFALRMATFMPRTCAFMRSAMARPAASSLAELTRKPDDRRCIEVASDDCDAFRFRCAFSEAMLVLMVCGM